MYTIYCAVLIHPNCTIITNAFVPSPSASCPAESKYNSELGHIFAWSKTTAGQSVRLPCPCNSTLDLTSEIYATRSCSVEGIWLSTDSSGCSATAVKDLCEVCVSRICRSVCLLIAAQGWPLSSGYNFSYVDLLAQ